MKSVVLVHGFMGGSGQWTDLVNDLDITFDVHAIDLPGFAENNSMQTPSTISGMADFVLQELDEKNIRSFYLLGHSMGGMIVQEVVSKAPDRIEGLILYGTSATGNLPNRFETFDVSKRRAREEGVIATADRISATWFLDHEKAINFAHCASIAKQSSPQALEAGFEAMSNWSLEDGLEHISCPTLIVWGEADRTYGWPQIDQLWQRIPNAHLAVIPMASHAAHLEKPEIFNSIVIEFLNCLE